jgi:glutamine amidotransferase-like uncharacterized protein
LRGVGATPGRSIRRLLAPLLAAATACTHAPNGTPRLDGGGPRVLLFGGTGTSPDDVASFEELLDADGLDVSTVSSPQLEAMDDAALRAYRLLIVPGGNFEIMGGHLSPRTTARIRDAVNGGLSYLGICGGAFLAGHLAGRNSIDLTSGVQFHFYSAERRGLRKAAVPISTPGAPALDQYWEDGPELGGWGEVVARYPDATPAVVQGTAGSGWVILAGVHPEAPDRWRRGMTFATPVEVDRAYARTLIRAALERAPLPHY